MAGKPPKNPEETWPTDFPEMAVSEFASETSGAASPFGEHLEFPLPVDGLGYVHPTAADRPNR